MIVIKIDRERFELYTIGLGMNEVIITRGISFYYKLDEDYLLQYEEEDSLKFEKMLEKLMDCDVTVIEVEDIKSLKVQ